MKVPIIMRGERHAISITVIGCGGTGSVLLQHLARINKSLIALGKKGIILTCVDPDKVTEANLGRQLFTQQDIGRPKAIVMVERINRFYGTNWIAIAEKFDKNITEYDYFPGNLVISCVDNVATRKWIANYINRQSLRRYRENVQNELWIDTGNRKDFGQVILSTEIPKIPNALDMFPQAAKDENKDDTPSCSLAEALGKQDLFINSMVALTTAQLVWDITQKPEINWRGAFINLNKQTPIRRIKV